MHRHKWKAVKLGHYNLPSRIPNLFPEVFGGTKITLICRKCGKNKSVDFPDQRLEVKDFVDTPYEIEENYTNVPDVSDTLTALGDIVDEETHGLRRRVLVADLKNTSSIIREGAILGLSRLGDPDALCWLREALETEPHNFMQRTFKQVIEQLEEKNG